jgi:hypothetical protein
VGKGRSLLARTHTVGRRSAAAYIRTLSSTTQTLQITGGSAVAEPFKIGSDAVIMFKAREDPMRLYKTKKGLVVLMLLLGAIVGTQ